MSTDKLSTWESSWSKGETPWQLADTNEKLLNNMDELIGCTRNGETTVKTILVPLCGKTKDMLYLYNKGHSVAGCEWVETAATQFFTDNNITFNKSPLENVEGFLYQSEDGRLRIYQCDFLLLTTDVVDWKFDSVWDIQSLVSINPRDRKQYVRAVRSLLKYDFRYLLVTVEYEPFAHLGRPHSISYNAVKELFGSFSNIKFTAQLPASAPLKSTWKENCFSMISGVEDRVQYWQARWATGQSQWHSDQPHKYLVKYIDQLAVGSSKVRIFLPMCGKAGDLMYLYQAGHTVLGVEGVPFVVEQFFRENKIEHEKTKMEELNGWKYKSKDGRMTVFACDFFLMTPAILGAVDAVYDRGALTAITPQDRQSYIAVMKNLLSPEFRYILNAYEYDDTMFQGPPRNLPRDEVFNLFEKFAEVDILEESDDDASADAFNLEWMTKVVFILKPANQ